LFQAATEPFCGKGFLAQDKGNHLSCDAMAKPSVRPRENEQGWYFFGLEKDEGPAR